MGGLHIHVRWGIALTLLTAPLATSAADDEDPPQFESTGATVRTPPPPRRSLCPPSTKDEVCRCVVYGENNGTPRFLKLANAPKYCNDPRLKAAFSQPEGEYLELLFKVQEENGDKPHDGPSD